MKFRLWELGVFVLCISLAGTIPVVSFFWVRPMLNSATGTLNQTKWAAQRVNDNLVVLGPRSLQISRDLMEFSNDAKAAAKASREEWESSTYIIGRRRYFQASDYLIRVLNQVDQEALPEVIAVLSDLRATTQSATGFVRNLDREVNGALLPQITILATNLAETAKVLNTDIAIVAKAIEQLVNESKLTLTEIRGIVASPEWLQILKNIEASTKSLSEAAAETPSMARSVEKILSTTSKYQKALLLFQILGTAVNILRP